MYIQDYCDIIELSHVVRYVMTVMSQAHMAFTVNKAIFILTHTFYTHAHITNVSLMYVENIYYTQLLLNIQA